MLLLGARVRVKADDDVSLDGKFGNVLVTEWINGYYGVVLDDPPSWVMRMFPDGIVPLTEDEVERVCG